MVRSREAYAAAVATIFQIEKQKERFKKSSAYKSHETQMAVKSV